MPGRSENRPLREVDPDEPIWQVRAPGHDGALTMQVNVPFAAVEGLRNAAEHANPEGLSCWIVIVPSDEPSDLLL